MKNSLIVGLVIINLILLGLLSVFIFKKDNKLSSNENTALISGDNMDNNVVEDSENSDKNDLKCQDGWEKYSQDAIGISFCYPQEWGMPYADSIRGDITSLAKLDESFKEQSIHYNNYFNVKFEKNDFIILRFFNDNYNVKDKNDQNADADYYESGSIASGIVELRNSGDICNYNIDVVDLKAIYSKCDNHVKTFLTKNTQFFGFSGVGTVYSYDYSFLAFKKLSNNYFNYLLIKDKVNDYVSQIKENFNTEDEYFDNKKIRKNGNKEVEIKNREEVAKERQTFETFVNSIQTYAPVERKIGDFKAIEGENSQINLIRKYYWLIESGKLQEAYNLIYDNSKIDWTKFQENYKDTYLIELNDFKKVTENQYDFNIVYQDHNSNKRNFRVVMEVNNDKIKTNFLEEIISPIVEKNGMKAYSTIRGDKNYVVLRINGKEIIVDEVATFRSSETGGHFGNLIFSEKGSYLIYSQYSFEWSSGKIYDIQNKVKISEDKISLVDSSPKFTDDEKFVYFCSGAGMRGESTGIYSVPNFKLVFDALKDERTKGFTDIDCSYNKDKNSIIFEFSNYYGDSEEYQNNDKKLEIIYNLDTGKVN